MAYIIKTTIRTDAEHSIDGKPHQRANYLARTTELMGLPVVVWTSKRKEAMKFATKRELNKYAKRLRERDIELLKVK